MNTTSIKYIFHVHGMHCPSCPILVENELKDLPQIKNAKADLRKKTVEIQGDFTETSPEKIVEDLSRTLIPFGYKLSVEIERHNARWNEFKIALPVALAFITLFIILQKLGIINLVQASKVDYSTAFAIGLVASVSSCMAVVGGLLLSLSAQFTKTDKSMRPQVYFHLGRLISFFVLGGIIGTIGSAFTLGTTSTFILGMLIGLVMLILGINLLDIAPWMKKLQPTLPRFIASRALSVQKVNHALTPLLIGIVTFFLPCGFTQSMQLYALSTGHFVTGALTMLSFALGTLPVLALISFGAVKIQKKMHSGIFFKTAGLVVIFFAGLNIITSLTAMGIIPPLFIL